MSLVDFGKRLLEAAKRGDTDDVRTLMSNGAPFTTDWLGTSPLHFAAQFGHVATAEVLLRAGISRDARTKVDRTPLHVACQEGHIEIVDLLIKSGADVEAKDMLKMTPLHWAVEKGHIGAVQLLIKQGSDALCENKFDKSSLDIAIGNSRSDIVQLLQLAQTTNVLEVTHEPPTVEEEVLTSIDDTEIVTSSEANVITPTQTLHMTTPRRTQKSLKKEKDAGGQGTGDQSSTSVLATLAALAEASGPLNATTNVPNTTAAESALNWLETHGITMISSSDSPTIMTTSSLAESGARFTLTEAGKLALKYVKHEEEEEEPITETVVEEGTVVDETSLQQIDTVITEDGEQKVLVISSEDGVQLDNEEEGSVVVAVAPGGDAVSEEDEQQEQPPSKKMKRVVVGTTEDGHIDQEDLQQQLAEIRREAEEYKLQLKQKEQEAEDYKKQLDEMVSSKT